MSEKSLLLSVFQGELNERNGMSIMELEFFFCELVALCLYLINRMVALQSINVFK